MNNSTPGKEKKAYWIFAQRKAGIYPSHTDSGGKWLIFVDVDKIDTVWEKIKSATEKGLLGEESKTATARENPNAVDQTKKVICVYTYDHRDKADVMRIRQALRDLGIRQKIPYKTDKATDRGEYRASGHGRISVYYE